MQQNQTEKGKINVIFNQSASASSKQQSDKQEETPDALKDIFPAARCTAGRRSERWGLGVEVATAAEQSAVSMCTFMHAHTRTPIHTHTHTSIIFGHYMDLH